MRLLIFLMTIPLITTLNAQSKLVLDLSALSHQKYEYSYLHHNDLQPQMVYQIKINEATLFLEIQPLQTKQELGSNAIMITDLNEQDQLNTLEKFNEKAQKIIVLDKFQIQYELSSIAILKELNDNSLTYQNWKYKFQLDQTIESKSFNPSISNIQSGGNQIEYIETKHLNCIEIFVIRQYYSKKPSLYTEINFNPTFGIIKESNVNNFGEIVQELVSINDQPLADYLESFCTSRTDFSLTLREKGPVKTTQEYHIVQKGETLYQIARKYNLSTAELINLNNLTSSQIKIGDLLYLVNQTKSTLESNKPLIETHPEMFDSPKNTPLGRLGQTNGNALIKRGLPQKYASSNTNSYNSKRKVHYVLSGETLYSIAKKYNTSVEVLIEINQLDRENPKIRPDQKLFIN